MWVKYCYELYMTKFICLGRMGRGSILSMGKMCNLLLKLFFYTSIHGLNQRPWTRGLLISSSSTLTAVPFLGKQTRYTWDFIVYVSYLVKYYKLLCFAEISFYTYSYIFVYFIFFVLHFSLFGDIKYCLISAYISNILLITFLEAPQKPQELLSSAHTYCDLMSTICNHIDFWLWTCVFVFSLCLYKSDIRKASGTSTYSEFKYNVVIC